MNLYRLDYESPNGDLEPVTDILGPVLLKHWPTVRQQALALANNTGAVVRITRISGAGALKVVAHASGETHRIHRVTR